jgi:RNA polymerase sigma-70 factor (ECF subfamily)
MSAGVAMARQVVGEVVDTGTGNDAAIYLQVRASLMRFATVLAGGDDADDIVSAVVVRTLERRTLSSLDDAQSYLMKAVLNEVRAQARRQRRFLRILSILGPPRAVDGPRIDDETGLVGALMALPPQQRAAVYLVYWEDLDSSEAADVMGCRAATVRRYLHLARRKLEGFVDES